MSVVRRVQEGTSGEQLVLPPAASSPRAARRWADRALVRLGAQEHADAVHLLLTELVTNAVLHAGSSVCVVLQVRGDELYVEVRDESPALPRRRHYPGSATTGRGLALVEELADAWGCEQDSGGGKAVWFRLRLPAAGGAA